MPIKSVTVKNYKSIKDASVSFKPGLNIIIGNNGSGKTNFLNVIESTLNIENDTSFNSYYIQILSDYWQLQSSFTSTDEVTNLRIQPNLNQHIYTNNRTKISQKIHQHIEFLSQIEKDHQINFANFFVSHSLTKESLFLDSPINKYIHLKEVEQKYRLTTLLRELSINGNETPCASYLKIDLAISAFRNKNDIKENWTKIIDKFCQILNNSITNDLSFSKIRVSENLHINYSEKEDLLQISNFYFEFFTNNRWNLFNELSDGTKRLVHIFFTIADPRKQLNDFSKVQMDEIFLIEEPELGIHPHQLHKLMNFLKEESETKQIIITTHSPVVLDILNKDELDRIIISEHTPEKGSTFRHMTEEEKADARDYMKDVGYLSYYWRFSDFNRV